MPGSTLDDELHRSALRARLDAAVASSDPLPSPVAVVDLDAFDANAADLVRRAGGKSVRLATKSLRVPALIRRALATPGFSGVLSFTLAEALWLHEQGLSDDIVLAYPTVDRGALARLFESSGATSTITLMVDNQAQLDLIDTVRGGSEAQIRLCLDVDASLHVARRTIGPLRSPVRDPIEVARMARLIDDRDGFSLVGVMTYEGQVAGLQDSVPCRPAMNLGVFAVKRASIPQLRRRRAAVREAVAPFSELEFFNAGGSGSVETSVSDPAVTEVAAGSGLLVPRLFDHYRSFTPRPASFFALPVTRRPTRDTVTVHGGGLVASGPIGADRWPTPWLPAGLELTGLEGVGEVQTPLVGPGQAGLRIGDLVWFRHAKSGELFEHTTTAHLMSGDRFIEHAPTYRGEGLSF